jgi:hypothetical protein
LGRKKEEARKQRGKHQIPESKVPGQKNTKEPNVKDERSVNFKRPGGDEEGGAERRYLSFLLRKEELPATLPVHPKIP